MTYEIISFQYRRSQHFIYFHASKNVCQLWKISQYEKVDRKFETFSSKSSSSFLAFLSYPGGGNGKQRDIAQSSATHNTSAFHRRNRWSYFPAALFRKANEPTTMLLSMHHVPVFISSINIPPWASQSLQQKTFSRAKTTTQTGPFNRNSAKGRYQILLKFTSHAKNHRKSTAW